MPGSRSSSRAHRPRPEGHGSRRAHHGRRSSVDASLDAILAGRGMTTLSSARPRRRRTSGRVRLRRPRRSTCGTRCDVEERWTTARSSRSRARARTSCRRRTHWRCARSRCSRRLERYRFRFVNRDPARARARLEAAHDRGGLVAALASVGRSARGRAPRARPAARGPRRTTSRPRARRRLPHLAETAPATRRAQSRPTCRSRRSSVVPETRHTRRRAPPPSVDACRTASGRRGAGRAPRAPRSRRPTPKLLAIAFHDRLHEPYREADAPLLGAARDRRSRPGGVTLSGSGPPVVVWSRRDRADRGRRARARGSATPRPAPPRRSGGAGRR
jgi:hypothetical protein